MLCWKDRKPIKLREREKERLVIREKVLKYHDDQQSTRGWEKVRDVA